MIELEQSILGQFILYPETHIYIMRLNPNWFTEYRKELVSELQTMYMHNEPITLGSIAKNFRKNLSEIATLQNIVTTNIYIEKEINQLEHYYKLEEIKRKMHDFDYNRTLQDIVNDLSLIISESTISLFTKPYNMSVVAGSVIDELYEATKRDNQITGIATGWKYLDKYLGGWNQGNMVIVAGRPGSGKTAIALTLAIECCKWSNVLFISLEMSKEEIAKRYLSFISDVENYRIRSAKLNDDDISRIADELYNKEIDFFIDDSPNNEIYDIVGRIKLHKAKYGLEVVFIDYLQLITHMKKGNREQEIAHISRTLKLLAKELKITIIALAQLSRESEKRADKRPMLSDLRESGQIEQDADIVLFPFRPAYYENEKPEIELDAELIIAKNRHGGLCVIPCTFEGKYTRYKEQL